MICISHDMFFVVKEKTESMCKKKTHTSDLLRNKRTSTSHRIQFVSAAYSFLQKSKKSRKLKKISSFSPTLLENWQKVCYNQSNVGAGIPVGVYVSLAHRHQEMLSVSSTSLPALFFVPADRTRYFLYVLF